MNIFLGILIVLWLYFLWSRRKFYLLSLKVPTKYGFPILGIAINLVDRKNIIKHLLGMKEELGSPHITFLGLDPFLMVSDPITAEKILTSSKCTDKAVIYSSVHEFLNGGLFTDPNPVWSRHRKLINPSFSHKILTSFFPIFNRESNVFNQILSKYDSNVDIDLTCFLHKMTLSISVATTMGQTMDFQTGENPHLVASLQRALDVTTRRIFVPWLRNNFIFRLTSGYKIVEDCRQEYRHFIIELIKTKMEKSKQEKQQDENYGSTNLTNNDDNYEPNDVNIKKSANIFLDQAYNLMERNEFDIDEVISESMVMVGAAYETTSNTVFITLLCLAMFPEYQEKVYEELKSIFHDEKNFEITYEDTQNLTYLDIIINESMRFMTPVPIVARMCTDDVDLGNGIILPKGVQVGLDIFNLHRDEKIWGPRAKTFDPEHFAKENFTKMHPYSFIPFTKGIRNCIGWRYALLAVKVILAKTLLNFRFTTQTKVDDLQFLEDIVLRFNNKITFNIHKR